MCGFQVRFLSIVIPRYFVESTVLIVLLFSFSFVIMRLRFGAKTIATVFRGLNSRFAVWLQLTSLSIIDCNVLCIWVIFLPAISMHRSSAKPWPIVVSVFMISSVWSNAIIQNLAEQTPPWGKPIWMVPEALWSLIWASRFLWVM